MPSYRKGVELYVGRSTSGEIRLLRMERETIQTPTRIVQALSHEEVHRLFRGIVRLALLDIRGGCRFVSGFGCVRADSYRFLVSPVGQEALEMLRLAVVNRHLKPCQHVMESILPPILRAHPREGEGLTTEDLRLILLGDDD